MTPLTRLTALWPGSKAHFLHLTFIHCIYIGGRHGVLAERHVAVSFCSSWSQHGSERASVVQSEVQQEVSGSIGGGGGRQGLGGVHGTVLRESVRPDVLPPEKCIRRGLLSCYTKMADWTRAFKITRYLVGGEVFSVPGPVSWTHWIASSNVLADDWTCDVLLPFVDSEVPPARAMWEGTSVNPLSVGNWGGAFAGGRGSARKHGDCLMRVVWFGGSVKGNYTRSRSPQTWSPYVVNGHVHRVKQLGAAQAVKLVAPGCREK